MILAFGHQKRQGKDECVKYALELFLHEDRRAHRAAFADKLKDVSYQLFSWGGLQPRLHYDAYPEKKEVPLPAIGKSPRQIYIEIGDLMRKVNGDVWIESIDTTSTPNTVISDLRYKNELNWVKRNGGYTFKVVRPSVVVTDTNAAEVELIGEKFDFTIVNDGTLLQLREKVFNCLRQLPR